MRLVTPNREDYLKLILELGGDRRKVSNKQIVTGLAVAPASVSEMITKLVKEGLVAHTPYQGVQLSQTGLATASMLIRKHRLWEVFLVEHLGYSWNEVHDDAEVLEHVTSEKLAQRLSTYMSDPEICPHGGMIPKAHETVHEKDRQLLTEFTIGDTLRIARVLDERELLDYLVTLDIQLGAVYQITAIAPYEGPITIRDTTGREVAVSYKACSTIFVDQIKGAVE